ncbi:MULTISPECIES: hypothetical protein [unclassified Tolypothrix]|uniref:hypothetical protein n=1 Tax=unclassified Tolypothrix TaxID=2649714 RepID=UPI0005EAC418|nr:MULTISPECIES: hypothetical protein [unclassified Tolypothrix]BAY94302.1 hypothetical protein NIES3275_63480 [Microchaete diplosiphon NIES-3275]EKF03946.1 hypothetical protein FDUTEX481_02949 [Tolypothrix sp. PCC 7601]MBE9086052.1 hypothetical protein [Tolypothrix sp. LEGE 11397]UYD28036.1 hypothetical protein HGR01_08320 [Tolypothrix sp. PCC 7712]UYD36093.1 hypothetical protein HG267_10305 [Tolypothrix sp. PCC 7601]
MRVTTLKLITPILVALIPASAAVLVALISKSNPEMKPPLATTSTISLQQTNSECNQSKICVANLTVQINSDEPLQVNKHQRIPLKAGDNLKVLNLNYCVPNAVSLNKLEAKAFLFKNGVENYQKFLSTPSQFPINAGVCHKVGNFSQSWKVEPGMHQAMIPIIKYDGSNKVVDKSFYFTLDVGQ